MTSKPDAKAPAQPSAPKKKPTRRPKWLPAEFKNPEELVAAYQAARAPAEPALAPQAAPVEAPKYDGPVYPGDAQAAPSDAPPAPPEPDAAPMDLTEFEREFCETGGICEKSYAKLERMGASRWLVDRHIEGRRAVAEAARREIVASVGGEERFAAIQAWARESLPEAEIAAYEEAIRGGKEKAKLAVLGLAAAYAKAAGDAPRLVGGGGQPTEGGAFANADELAKAIRDPRYRSDPEYRAEIAARLSQRSVF